MRAKMGYPYICSLETRTNVWATRRLPTYSIVDVIRIIYRESFNGTSMYPV